MSQRKEFTEFTEGTGISYYFIFFLFVFSSFFFKYETHFIVLLHLFASPKSSICSRNLQSIPFFFFFIALKQKSLLLKGFFFLLLLLDIWNLLFSVLLLLLLWVILFVLCYIRGGLKICVWGHHFWCQFFTDKIVRYKSDSW